MRESAKKDVAAEVNKIMANPAQYPIISSLDDQAVLVYNNSSDNYMWYIQPVNLPSDGSGVDFNNSYRVSEALVDSMQLHHDPRLTIYTAPTKNSFNAHKADTAAPLVYRGQPVGLTVEQQAELNKNDYSVVGKAIRSDNRAFILTFAEVQMIKAEAILRGMTPGNAEEEYAKGVKASLEKWKDISPEQAQAYLSQPDIRLSSHKSTALEQIGVQCWIDSFLNGFEGYASWRRTGVPQLKPSASVLSPIPVRYVYSDTEMGNPNLVAWIQEHYGRKVVYLTDKVWFQP